MFVLVNRIRFSPPLAPQFSRSTGEEMDTKKERVLSFFDVEIGQFILGDLDVLAHIRPHPSTQLGGCTVPQAMLIFAALDLLGFLVNDDPNACKTKTAKNYQAIFSSDLGLFPVKYEAATDVLVKLFRHGVVHQFFSKASGMGKFNLSIPFILRSGAVPCLNIDRLTEDFTNAVRVLRERIASGKYNSLAERINDRLDVLAYDDYADLRKLVEETVEPSAGGDE
jgi:hypothetical protein